MLKFYAIEQLQKQIPKIAFNANSHKAFRNYNLLNVRLPVPKEKASTILFQLDLAGICCSRLV